MYMGAEAVHTVVTALLEAGRSPHTACALIENASCPNERVWFSALIALPALVDRVELTGPAIIMMGEVYAHAQTKNVQQPSTQVEYVAPYATLQRQWSA
jgi:uroporphyrin-III C-methyltransferase/precorrin-2 dehydrogenase/sirohydrochlorin ferrochelatase